jgi:hypothetical protein
MSSYAYCESVHAGGLSPWHIRELDQSGKLKLGGGITTNSLCGRVARGWDLNVPISLGHDKHTCRDCLIEFRAAAARPEGSGEVKTAWLLEAPGPKYVTVDDFGYFEWTTDANEALQYRTEAQAKEAHALLSDPYNTSSEGLFEEAGGAKNVQPREHAWP